jgi:hypothetical protein
VHYTVKLVARNECIEYRDEHDVYRFRVAFKNKTWVVSLPGSKGASYQPHELTHEEGDIVLARVKKYLEKKKYFGVVGPTYPVVFERERDIPAYIVAARERAARYWQDKESKEKAG